MWRVGGPTFCFYWAFPWRAQPSIFIPASGERERITYYADGNYLPESITTINRLLRDFETEAVGSIDVKLLDILHSMLRSSEIAGELEVVRGHISNSPGRSFESGDPNAFHNSGQAIDVRVAGLNLDHLAMDFVHWFDDGLGIYPKKKFVHLDLDPPQRWVG